MKNGVYTALVTPFLKNGKIDFDALKKLINIQISAKVSGIVLMGTTGESPTLSSREKRELIEFVLPLVKDRTEIWIGCGSNCTASTIRNLKKLNKYNLDGVLLSLPAYNKPNFSGLLNHIQKCCCASRHNIMLYHVPSRTGLNLSAQQLIALCQNQKIVAIKEASGNLQLFYSLVQGANKKIFSGNDPELFHSLALGGSGIVSVASNAIPKQIVRITNLFFSHKKKVSQTEFKQIESLLNALFIETNPVPIKYLLQKLKLCKSTVRLPLGNLSKASEQKLNDLINLLIKK